MAMASARNGNGKKRRPRDRVWHGKAKGDYLWWVPASEIKEGDVLLHGPKNVAYVVKRADEVREGYTFDMRIDKRYTHGRHPDTDLAIWSPPDRRIYVLKKQPPTPEYVREEPR
jgi:hypothetical protein